MTDFDVTEHVRNCPICDSTNSALFIDSVMDNIYFFPGKWPLAKCQECGTIYLRKRLRQSKVKDAYASYYTKDTKEGPLLYRRWIWFRNKLVALSRPTLAFLPFAALNILTFGLLAKANSSLRGLANMPPPKTILDIGYGDGSFLDYAKSLGHNCYGIEFDQECVEIACAKGIKDIGENTRSLNAYESFFDQITLSHSLEHMYNPREVIRDCYTALKPGGVIWVETPNATSQTLMIFGKHWRGLESPRHIFIPTWHALADMLTDYDFVDIAAQPKALTHLNMIRQSIMLERRALGLTKFPLWRRWRITLLCIWRSLFSSNGTELVTISAVRPTLSGPKTKQ